MGRSRGEKHWRLEISCREWNYYGLLASELIWGFCALEVPPSRPIAHVWRFQLASNGTLLEILKWGGHNLTRRLPEAYAYRVRVASERETCSEPYLATRWIKKEGCVYRCAHNRIGVVGLSQAVPHTHTTHDVHPAF